jgi:hypothetical protein
MAPKYVRCNKGKVFYRLMFMRANYKFDIQTMILFFDSRVANLISNRTFSGKGKGIRKQSQAIFWLILQKYS